MSTHDEMRAILQELHDKFNQRVYGTSSYIKRDMRDRIAVALAAPVAAQEEAPVAYYNKDWTLTPAAYREGMRRCPAAFADMKPAYAGAAAPDEGEARGWISVEDRLPESNVEVLCAGQGWADPFVTACYYDTEQEGWWTMGHHWTDQADGRQYPTHWMPLPAPPASQGGQGL
jgi:hypothetical protein